VLASLAVLGEGEWVNPLISAMAALAGAVIGGGVVLYSGHLEHKERRAQEHREALVHYWAAVNGFAATMGTFAPSGNVLDRFVTNIETRIHLGRLIDRMYAASDALWRAGGRLRAVATVDELAAINEVERVLGMWKFGEPVPDEWTAAINVLRLRLEEPALKWSG
jgi:hypothetical protein